MKTRMQAFLFVGALGASVAAAPAYAQRDPLVRWAQQTSGPGEFYLNNNDEREIVRYTTPRDIRLCLPRRERPPAPPVQPRPDEIPVSVTWDGASAVLFPGNCLYFDARRVSVRPASPVPSGMTIHGFVETERALR